jgi:phosphatidylglycerol:prolipoprotein diacylglycerol transferase
MLRLNLLKQFQKKREVNRLEKIKNIFKKPYMLYVLSFLYVILLITIAVSQDETPYSNVALDLGFAQIAWYALFILSGIVIASLFAVVEFKRKGLKVDFLYDALLWTVPLAILGARLYYVIFDPDGTYQTFMDVINISRGGLAIHGAIITSVVFVLFYVRKRQMNLLLILDIVAVGFFIGQIVGRWGNFMNQEAYGPVIQSEFVLNILPNFIKDQMLIGNLYRHPTFLYESILNLIGLIGLLIIRRKRIFKIGDHFALYIMYYGLVRGAFIEPLRTGGATGDALRIFGQPVNIYLSLIVFLGGGALFMYLKHKKYPDLPFYTDKDI